MLKAYTNFFQVQRIHVVIENFTMVEMDSRVLGDLVLPLIV